MFHPQMTTMLQSSLGKGKIKEGLRPLLNKIINLSCFLSRYAAFAMKLDIKEISRQ